jgi:hypothetical protein
MERMKHLRKYNESLSKDPIDPTLDVEDFKEKFAKKKMYNNELIIDEPNIKRILDIILNNNATMTDDWEIYGIFRVDGKRRGDYMFYVKAVSKEHARLKGATYRNNIEIISTGYYGSEELSERDIDGMIDALQHEIHLLKNPI